MDLNENYYDSDKKHLANNEPKKIGTSLYNDFLLKKNEKKNEDNPIKVFCEKPQFKILCNLRDYIIMLALSLVGLLIIYVFIKIIDSKTKYHLIKSINYTKYK